MHPRRSTAAWFRRLSPEWQVRTALTVGLVASSAVGIAVVYALLTWVIPMPPVHDQPRVQRENVRLAAAFVAVVGPVGIVHAWRVLHPVVTALRPDTSHDPSLRTAVLAAPRRLFSFQALLWAVASLVFLVRNVQYELDLAVPVFLTVGLAGWGTSCQTYLIAERCLRPVARRVLSDGLPDRKFVRSVADRQMFAWSLGSGLSALGIVLGGLIALTNLSTTSTRQLAITMAALGAVTIVFGFLSSYSAARASSEPIRNLRDAVDDVEQGKLELSVPIYDGTEIGLLQAGFNEMVKGLRERAELRDLFGRHVGEDVARAALGSGVQLGGETRDVVVLFVDVVGSTALAEEREPHEVVEVLNRFFSVVIDVIHEHQGWINKFEGDAALAIWGAPAELPDMHTEALAAARELAQRLAAEVTEVRAGIGVACGTVVAGNVGAATRYEYTVIGDPVNLASRLTGHAKNVPSMVVASCALVQSASDEEAAHWRELEPIEVRGRSQPAPIAELRRPVGQVE